MAEPPRLEIRYRSGGKVSGTIAADAPFLDAKLPDGRGLPGMRTEGIAGRPGFLSWPPNTHEFASIIAVVRGDAPSGVKVEFAREVVLPLLLDRAAGDIGYARVVVATATPVAATPGDAVLIEGGTAALATSPLSPRRLRGMLDTGGKPMPRWDKAVVPALRDRNAVISIGSLHVVDLTVAEFNALQPRTASELLSVPPHGQPDSPLRVSDADATPANTDIPADAKARSHYAPWHADDRRAQAVGGNGRAVAAALAGTWSVPPAAGSIRLAWMVPDEDVGPDGRKRNPWRDGGSAQEFAATLAACGTQVVAHGGGWIGAGLGLAGVREDGNALVRGQGSDQIVVPGSRQTLLTGGVAVVRARLLGPKGDVLATTRFLLADPADVLFVTSHHAIDRFFGWSKDGEAISVVFADWIESLAGGTRSSGRSQNGVGVVLLGCDTLPDDTARNLLADAMKRGAVRFALGSSGPVPYRDEYAAIYGIGHPRRIGILSALAAISAWSSVQLLTGNVLKGLSVWAERATVIMGYLKDRSLDAGVGYGVMPSTGEQVGYDPRQFAEYSADGGLFRCVGTTGGKPPTCPEAETGRIGPQYRNVDELGIVQAISKQHYLRADNYGAEVFRQRLAVLRETRAGRAVMRPVGIGAPAAGKP